MNKDTGHPVSMFGPKELFTSNGIARTKSLFKEVAVTDEHCLFTLEKNSDYIKLKDIYVKLVMDDPSENSFVETVFGDWKVWNKIKECSWFTPYYEVWEEEATVKRKSKAFQTIVEEATGNGRNRLQAAKYLLDEPWKGRTKPAREKRLATTEEAYAHVDKDLDRIREHIN